MNEEKEKRYIYHNLKEMFSSSGSTAKLDLIIDTETGEVTVELKKSYAKTYSLKELQRAKIDYEKLNGGGYIIDIERLCKMRTLKAGLEHLED